MSHFMRFDDGALATFSLDAVEDAEDLAVDAFGQQLRDGSLVDDRDLSTGP
jgi:hypothetical protein